MVSVKPSSSSLQVVTEALKNVKTGSEWLELKGTIASVVRYPERKDITENVEEQLVVEYYSR